jgi:hypothetical protein
MPKVRFVLPDFVAQRAEFHRRARSSPMRLFWIVAWPPFVTIALVGLFIAFTYWSAMLLALVDRYISSIGTIWFWILAVVIGAFHILLLAGAMLTLCVDFRQQRLIKAENVVAMAGLLIGGALAIWWITYGLRHP